MVPSSYHWQTTDSTIMLDSIQSLDVWTHALSADRTKTGWKPPEDLGTTKRLLQNPGIVDSLSTVPCSEARKLEIQSLASLRNPVSKNLNPEGSILVGKMRPKGNPVPKTENRQEVILLSWLSPTCLKLKRGSPEGTKGTRGIWSPWSWLLTTKLHFDNLELGWDLGTKAKEEDLQQASGGPVVGPPFRSTQSNCWCLLPLGMLAGSTLRHSHRK